MCDDEQWNNKLGKINRGLMGKMGRRADISADDGYLRYQNMKNNLRSRFQR